jgi:hypothetical protein
MLTHVAELTTALPRWIARLRKWCHRSDRERSATVARSGRPGARALSYNPSAVSALSATACTSRTGRRSSGRTRTHRNRRLAALRVAMRDRARDGVGVLSTRRASGAARLGPGPLDDGRRTDRGGRARGHAVHCNFQRGPPVIDALAPRATLPAVISTPKEPGSVPAPCRGGAEHDARSRVRRLDRADTRRKGRGQGVPRHVHRRDRPRSARLGVLPGNRVVGSTTFEHDPKCDNWPALLNDVVKAYPPRIIATMLRPWEMFDRETPSGRENAVASTHE